MLARLVNALLNVMLWSDIIYILQLEEFVFTGCMYPYDLSDE